MAAEAGEAPACLPAQRAQPARPAALSPWLQLMLAEIARKRAAIEHERAEAARRVLERAAEPSDTRAANPAAAAHGETPAAPRTVLHMSSPQRGS
jgi:hypothetical protein